MKYFYYGASFVCLLVGIFFICISVMLYKNNYSQYKSKDDCDKAPSSFLNAICPFWDDKQTKCVNGMYDNYNKCIPKNIISSIITAVSSILICIVGFYYGFKEKD